MTFSQRLDILKISLMAFIANFSHSFAEGIIDASLRIVKIAFANMHRIRLFCCKCKLITFPYV